MQQTGKTAVLQSKGRIVAVSYLRPDANYQAGSTLR